MRGGLKLADRGAIPRLLSGVYRRGRKVEKDTGGGTSAAVTLAYYEIYNDKVFDLFEPPEKRTAAGLRICEKDGKTIVVGLSERSCTDLKEFESLYIEANNNRSVGSTKLNAESSRSHAILMVKVTQTTGERTRISTASAIDLAGSEDNRRTENGKERMVESASINKSLFVLSQCIDAIGRGDKRIPYRESKMTRILSLGQNNGITIMILNLAPLRSYHLDTLSSLNVSSRAKRIEVREIENEIVFKQPPKSMSNLGGTTMNRQPLRPLANAANTHIAPAALTAKPAGEKPAKMFSVYADKARTAKPVAKPVVKRSSDVGVMGRVSKISRPALGQRATAPELSAAKLEEMVERKVSEILASRAAVAPAPPQISDEVQRRLDSLERKIEQSSGEAENARNEGLRFLLMAKQHKEHGQDSSALKMYEMAQPYFPAQVKLERKIEALRKKIEAKRQAENPQVLMEMHTGAEMEDPFVTGSPILRNKKRKMSRDDEDDVYEGSMMHDDAATPQKVRKPKAKTQLKVFQDEEQSGMSPRKQYILNVVNSRDITQIKGLNGIGAKKARDLLDFLELQSAEVGGRMESLDQLMGAPGMGMKTVEKMYEGINV